MARIQGYPDVNKMTLQQLQDVKETDPSKWDENRECRTIIMVPTRRKHDSGYSVMEFVLEPVNMEYDLVKIAGTADVIHINGIGGLGLNWMNKPDETRHTVPAVGWQIDCLWRSKCLRLFICGGDTIIVGPALSSFEVWAKGGK